MSIVNHQIVGFSKKQRSAVNRVQYIDLNEAYYAGERRALSKSILEKEMVERAIIRIIHNKIIEGCLQKNVHLSQG